MQRGHLISSEAMLSLWSKDAELCAAVHESRRSLPEFFKSFERREPAQREFIVAMIRREADTLMPLGLLVERIENRMVEGREVPNNLACQPAGPIHCRVDEIIDWRFIDAFELVGGRLYLALYRRQPPPVQRALSDSQPFLLSDIGRGEPMNAEFRQLLRDISNLRYAEVKRKLEANPSLGQKLEKSPVREVGAAGRIVLRDVTISRFAARFSNAVMVRLLYDLGVLRDVKGPESPLMGSVCAENVETTRCLLELGFDPNDDTSVTPLMSAVSYDRREVVRELVAHGADPNLLDGSLRSVLFIAKSRAVAKLLIDAGARLDLVDENGKTAVQYHMENGRIGIANELVKHGAKADPQAHWGPTESEIIAMGTRDLKQYLQQNDPQGFENLRIQESVDYGCVLPIRCIQVSGSSAS